MQFRLLGPVELWDGERRIELGTMKQRTVLAALLADAGKTVSPDVLIDRVWGERPPNQARNALHTYVARLRGLLGRLDADGAPRLVKQPAGYRLDAGEVSVDLHRFRELAAADGTLGEAIALWRGDPLDGADGDWAAGCRDRWLAEHRDAVVRWADREIGAGRGSTVIEPLDRLAERYPLVEPVVEVLMRALHAAGRDPEALERYERLRRLLADELGTDPGAGPQQLHRSLLQGEPAAGGAPAQIPIGVAGFVGRREQLARLDEPGEITVLHGTAGVGKTSLAVRWARAAAERFPDGQLYVDLHGFSAGGAMIGPAAALQRFLVALGVPAPRVPLELDDRAALYRSLIAGRRILVVLDNARDAEQVRPLLPGTPTARTVVTSRNRLSALLVAYGARPVVCDLLADPEAIRLVAGRIGELRAAREPAALREMAGRCAGLPLALAVLGSHIAMRPDVPLDRLAAELREDASTLDALASDDPAIDARTVFSWSLRGLSPAGARLFRLLGLQFGGDLSVPAAASLAALPIGQTRRLLLELLGAQLLTETGGGRFTMHDLLREYAAELAGEQESASDREQAQLRLLDHYLHVSHAARLRMTPIYAALTLPDVAPGVQVVPIADYAAGRDWFAAEYPVLCAAVRHAVTAGHTAHAWRLSWAFGKFQQQQGYWRDALDGGRFVLEAVIRAGDKAGEARLRHGLSVAFSRSGQTKKAQNLAEEAYRIQEEIGDTHGQALTMTTLGMMVHRSGDYARSRECFELSVELHRRVGNGLAAGHALNALGWLACTQGHYDEAVVFGSQALEAIEQYEDTLGRAAVWDTLGCAYHRLGQLDRAVDCLRRAVGFHVHADEHYYLASVNVHLGDALLDSGDRDAARAAWSRAEQLFTQLQHDEVAGVRRRLAGLGQSLIAHAA